MDLLIAVVNHLWQSTAVACAAFLLAWALQKNAARVRYWVWMAASVKFLLPFSLLIAAGEWLRGLMPAKTLTQPAVAAAMEQVAQSFSGAQFFDTTQTVAAVHHGGLSLWSMNRWPVALLAVWACGVVVVSIRFGRGWWRVYAAKRVAIRISLIPKCEGPGAPTDVPVLATTALIEPGVFGIFRPVLLLPEGILERLSAEQLRAIVAHEMEHVRRRDNLTFAFHMIVETLFWFYPPVWWIGARLIEEREQACDEAVVAASRAPQAYAEGILNVCKYYVESPVACVAGVTGADLKKRIARIMTERVGAGLNASQRILIGATALVALAAPLTLGLVRAAESAQQEDAGPEKPRYEVATIKPHPDEGMMMQFGMQMTPDGISVKGLPLQMLVRQAFALPADRILNEPEWLKSARFDIEAKVSPEDAPKLKSLSPQQRGEMMLPLLEERFGLKFHHEMKTLPVYTLVAAKGGPKLKDAKPEEAGGSEAMHDAAAGSAPGGAARPPRMMMRVSNQGMTMNGPDMTMAMLANLISQQTGSTVVDKTGLTGRYDVSLSFMPDMNGPGVFRVPGGGPPPDGAASSNDVAGPTLQDALADQLGLKLVLGKEPVDVVVIDQFEQPSAN